LKSEVCKLCYEQKILTEENKLSNNEKQTSISAAKKLNFNLKLDAINKCKDCHVYINKDIGS